MVDQSKEWQIMMKKENDAWEESYCCERAPAAPDLSPQMPRWLNEFVEAFGGMTESDTKQVAFQGLPHLEQQAMLDLLVKETWRHIDDVRVGWDEIQTAIAQNPNLIIRNVFIAKWVKIK